MTQSRPLRSVAIVDASSPEGMSITMAIGDQARFQVVRAITHKFTRSFRKRIEPLGVEPRLLDFTTASVDDFVSALDGIDTVIVSLRLLEDSSAPPGDCNQQEPLRRTLDLAATIFKACQRSSVYYVALLSSPSPLQELSLRAPTLELGIEVEMLARQLLAIPHTFLSLPMFYEAFLDDMVPVKTGKDRFQIEFPIGDASVHAISLADLGKIVLYLLRDPQKFYDQKLGLSAGHLTVQKVLKALNQTFSPNVFTALQTGNRDYAEFAPLRKQQWANTLHCYVVADTPRDPDLTQSMSSSLRTFKDWTIDYRRKLNKLMNSQE